MPELDLPTHDSLSTFRTVRPACSPRCDDLSAARMAAAALLASAFGNFSPPSIIEQAAFRLNILPREQFTQVRVRSAEENF